MTGLHIVTASLDPEKTEKYWGSWAKTWAEPRLTHHVIGVMGPVKAFLVGIEQAYDAGAEVVACLHDDLEITEKFWDMRIEGALAADQRTLLCGFGGAKGLGSDDIYRTPYRLEQLARVDFISNMRDAEAHGRRADWPEQVACLDGFSLIGKAEFMLAQFRKFDKLGVVHHAYDSWLGATAWRAGGTVWYIPVACHHAGGMTAVGDPRFAQWAADKFKVGGEREIRDHAHWMMYNDLRGVLPLRIR